MCIGWMVLGVKSLVNLFGLFIFHSRIMNPDGWMDGWMDGIGSEKPCQSFWSFYISFEDHESGWMDGWMDGIGSEKPCQSFWSFYISFEDHESGWMDGIGSEKPCRSFWSFFISFKDHESGWMDGWMDGLKVESPSYHYFLVFYFTKVQ